MKDKKQQLRICYLQSHYISHFRAGAAYRECLETLDIALVDDPSTADLVIIHNEPWTLPGYYRAFPELKRKYVVTYSVWEASLLPDYYRLCLGLVQEIWTASSYSQEIFRKNFSEVYVVPHVVSVPALELRAIEQLRKRIEYRDDLFYFYTITNANDPRKNVKALVRAFESLPDSQRARLLIKTNSPLAPELAKAPGVIPLYDESKDEEIRALHHLGHCFVSAHCAEAWGMGIAEAMSHGKLVVATGFGGNMDYMNRGNSLPVKFTLERIREEDRQARPSLWKLEMEWAYVDEEDLRVKMAAGLAGGEFLQSLGLQAQQDVRQFSPQNVALQLQKRLDAIPARHQGMDDAGDIRLAPTSTQ